MSPIGHLLQGSHSFIKSKFKDFSKQAVKFKGFSILYKPCIRIGALNSKKEKQMLAGHGNLRLVTNIPTEGGSGRKERGGEGRGSCHTVKTSISQREIVTLTYIVFC